MALVEVWFGFIAFARAMHCSKRPPMTSRVLPSSVVGQARNPGNDLGMPMFFGDLQSRNFQIVPRDFRKPKGCLEAKGDFLD